MPETTDWQIPPGRQPKPEDFRFDMDSALDAVVAVSASIPADAYSAETLGTERAGHGVLIGDNMVVTIGYLVTEAEDVWISLNDGRAVQGHVLGVDQATGFGLVLALGRLDGPHLALGSSTAAAPGDSVIIGGAGGRRHSLSGVIVGKQEFAGYWEYLLDEAIFTAPAHPLWGGAALINRSGELIGIGSLQVEGVLPGGGTGQLNMIVPIDLLKPVLPSLARTGQSGRPPRPWLGLFSAEVDGHVFVAAVSQRGPAATTDLRTGDMIAEVAGAPVATLAEFYRRVWSLGPPEVDVPLTVVRDGEARLVTIRAGDRQRFLRTPRLHS